MELIYQIFTPAFALGLSLSVFIFIAMALYNKNVSTRLDNKDLLSLRMVEEDQVKLRGDLFAEPTESIAQQAHRTIFEATDLIGADHNEPEQELALEPEPVPDLARKFGALSPEINFDALSPEVIEFSVYFTHIKTRKDKGIPPQDMESDFKHMLFLVKRIWGFDPTGPILPSRITSLANKIGEVTNFPPREIFLVLMFASTGDNFYDLDSEDNARLTGL